MSAEDKEQEMKVLRACVEAEDVPAFSLDCEPDDTACTPEVWESPKIDSDFDPEVDEYPTDIYMECVYGDSRPSTLLYRGRVITYPKIDEREQHPIFIGADEVGVVSTDDDYWEKHVVMPSAIVSESMHLPILLVEGRHPSPAHWHAFTVEELAKYSDDDTDEESDEEVGPVGCESVDERFDTDEDTDEDIDEDTDEHIEVAVISESDLVSDDDTAHDVQSFENSVAFGDFNASPVAVASEIDENRIPPYSCIHHTNNEELPSECGPVVCVQVTPKLENKDPIAINVNFAFIDFCEKRLIPNIWDEQDLFIAHPDAFIMCSDNPTKDFYNSELIACCE